MLSYPLAKLALPLSSLLLQVWLMTVTFPDGSQQLYVVENLIEGHYKKHNNNAGYVDQVCVPRSRRGL